MKRVVVIGSGSWGTTSAICIAENITKLNDFNSIVKIWVYEEVFDGKNLSEIINKEHINKKYLPDIKLPSNIIAETDLKLCIRDATHIVFVVPHQFIEKLANDLCGYILPNAVGISLIKGIIEKDDEPVFICELLQKKLGCHMSVLSGANIASEIALKKFSETTIGSTDTNIGNEWKKLFETEYFKVNVINCCTPLELCGALKNCIAIAAGFIDGLGQGINTKTAIIRIGLIEMTQLCELFVKIEDYRIFFESFGVADLITTCFGGRNRLVSKAFIETNRSFNELEKELLNGQKLQGPDTLFQIGNIVKSRRLENKFPLLMSTYSVIFDNKPRTDFLRIFTKCLTKR